MVRTNFIFIFIISFFSLSSQNGLKLEYLKNNCFEFNDSNRKIISALSEFDSYFIGERHTMKNLDLLVNSIITIVGSSKKINYVFLEMPFSDLMWYNYLNDSNENFDLKEREIKIISQGCYYEKVIRKGLDLNLSNKNKIRFYPIDQCNYRTFNITSLNLFFAEDSIKDDPTMAKDYNILYKRSFKTKRKLMREFYDLYQKKINVYQRLLKNNFEHFNRIINNYNEIIENRKLRPQLLDFKREMFMYNSINCFLKNGDVFISLNGGFHIPIKEQKEWLGNIGFESLAYLTKKYSKRKVCSIYLMNTSFDMTDSNYFLKAKKFLTDNLEHGKTYLLRLDDPDCPFLDLKENFTFLLFKNDKSF